MNDILSLVIGAIGAITGIISLIWHVLHSRSKVILEKVYFERAHRHTHKETIDISIIIRNKGNRATTIEHVYLIIGRRWIERTIQPLPTINPNSSFSFKLNQSFTPEEFKDILEEKNVKLGIVIDHTFATLRKEGITDFSTDYLNL